MEPLGVGFLKTYQRGTAFGVTKIHYFLLFGLQNQELCKPITKYYVIIQIRVLMK